MHQLFLVCALLGGAILVLQLVLGLVGGHHEVPHGHDLHLGHGAAGHAGHAGHAAAQEHDGSASGLDLFTARTVAAALAFFGAGGLAGESLGSARWLALLAAIVIGGAAMLAVAVVMRALLRLEDDGTVSVDNAVGATGTVYLSIPGQRQGTGKVHLTLQNRLVELQAVTPEATLPTGAAVLVVDVVGPDTVVVVPTPVDLLVDTEVSHVR